jgi:DNA-binding MarR family transcriptional regulator
MVVHNGQPVLSIVGGVTSETPLDPNDDIGLLATVVGQATGDRVLAALRHAGYDDVRTAHGYIFQGVLAGDRTTTELAERLGVSVQAVSKTVIELERAGYLTRERAAEDGRARTISLTARGERMIATSRAARRSVAEELATAMGERDAARLAVLMRRAVEHLDAAAAIAGRRLRPPA